MRPIQKIWISEPDTEPNWVGSFGSARYKDTIPLREYGKFCNSEPDTEPNWVGSFGLARYSRQYVATLFLTYQPFRLRPHGRLPRLLRRERQSHAGREVRRQGQDQLMLLPRSADMIANISWWGQDQLMRSSLLQCSSPTAPFSQRSQTQRECWTNANVGRTQYRVV